MSKSRLNYLKRVEDINKIYYQLINDSNLTNEQIYWQHIEPVYHISRATFYRILATNWQKELQEIEKQNDNQLKLF